DRHPGLGVEAKRAQGLLAERPPVMARRADGKPERLLEPLPLAPHLLGRSARLQREVDADLGAGLGEGTQLARDLGAPHVGRDVEAARTLVEEVERSGEEGRAAPVAEELAPLVPAVVRVGATPTGEAARG